MLVESGCSTDESVDPRACFVHTYAASLKLVLADFSGKTMDSCQKMEIMLDM